MGNGRKRINTLDDLAEERRRHLEQMMPTIRQAQEAIRQLEGVRSLIEATQRTDQLMRQAAEALKFNAPALELARQLTVASEAFKNVLGRDASMLENTKALTAQMEAFRSAFQIDASAFDALRNASFASDAMGAAIRVNTSALTSATKALSLQAETAAAMSEALRSDAPALDWAKTIASQFDTVRPMVAALQRAIPEFPKFEISSAVQDAMKSLAAMNLAPQLAAALEPPSRLSDLMREVARLRTNIDTSALLEAQKAAASIADSLRLSDLTPERFGIVFTEGEAETAWMHLMTKVQAIADDDEATPEDVIEFAAAVDAATAAVSPDARGRMALLVQALILALIVDLLKDGVKASLVALLPYLVALPLSFQPVPPPPLPPAPAPFAEASSADELGVPRSWDVEGLPQIIRRAGPDAERLTLRFFEEGVRNKNTRQAYAQAVMRFMNWCDDRNLELTDITVFTVSAYVAEMNREYAARSVRQHLGAIRGLFDHFVAGGLVPMNPATSVPGPQEGPAKNKRKPAAAQPQDIRLLLDSIDTGDDSGLRDRALIATMAYAFARVSAVVAMDVRDRVERDGHVYLRIHNRNGVYEIPAHPNALAYLNAYLAAAGIGGQPNSPLWRTMTKGRCFSADRMSRVDVFRMVKRRVREAGLSSAINCEAIRKAGIAAYLAAGGELAQASIQLEPGEGISPADIERIAI